MSFISIISAATTVEKKKKKYSKITAQKVDEILLTGLEAR